MAENWAAKTIETYDASAEQLADYFKGIGPRVDDIERAIDLADTNTDLRVVEIGCGDGRDAAEIVDRVTWYEGVEPSKGLLKLARQKLPDVNFVNDTIQNYEFPDDLDVVFAFASLLHLSREENAQLFPRVAKALHKGGVFFVSLKEGEKYEPRLQQDKFGDRMFYYYDVDTVRELAGDAFSLEYECHQTIGNTDWIELGFQRV
ncbi:class I SAM-dependent methyltransferase [Candidatus Saccharibacteria bacterium]|nr:class I SAM-dependent methyltransferase [Candidatus Saccharibacteria bacterium]